MPGDVDAFATLLVRRAPLLRLLNDAPKTKPELVAETDVSRSTVDRAVRDMEGAGVVERRNGAVVLTLVGRLALDSYEAFHADIASLADCRALRDLDADAPIEVRALRECSVVAASPNTPHRCVREWIDRLRTADRVELYGTMVLPQVLDALVDDVVDGSLDVEAYLVPPVIEALVSDFGERAQRALDSDAVSIAEVEGGPSFDLAVFRGSDGSETVCIGFGTHGLEYLVLNETTEAVAWAHERLAAVRSDAEPIA